SVHPVALSDRDGGGVLALSGTNSGDHGLARDRESPHRDVEEVTCMRFDSLVRSGQVDADDIGLMWMDTQGHEPFVMAGATEALERGTPWVIEYTPHLLAANGCLDLLEDIVRDHFTLVVDLRLLALGV